MKQNCKNANLNDGLGDENIFRWWKNICMSKGKKKSLRGCIFFAFRHYYELRQPSIQTISLLNVNWNKQYQLCNRSVTDDDLILCALHVFISFVYLAIGAILHTLGFYCIVNGFQIPYLCTEIRQGGGRLTYLLIDIAALQCKEIK